MDKQTLNAISRTVVGKKTEALRAEGNIPAVVYGHGETNRNITLSRSIFEKVLQKAGESSLLDLVVDSGTPLSVLIQDVQRDPLTGSPLHVDFYLVNMTEKLTTEIPLVYIGESPAVKSLGGILVKTLDHLKVECLPQDLVPEITVDLGVLNTFEDAIHVKDLAIPNGITSLIPLDEAVVRVQPPRDEEVVTAAAPTAEDVAKVEVAKKGKKEEEGDAAPAAKA